MALPKVHRLKAQQNFDAVYRHGLRYSTSHLVVRALPPQKLVVSSLSRAASLEPHDVTETQVGLSVSRKVSKRAVVRNQIKRRILAALRHLLPRMARGWRLVIGVRPAAVQCEYWQFLQELEQLLTDAEVLNGR